MANELTCTICSGPFDLDAEGGIVGDIGILPVAFCPTCKAGVFDMAQQMCFCEECPHLEDCDHA